MRKAYILSFALAAWGALVSDAAAQDQPPTPDCRAACEARAQAVLDECLAAGVSPEICQEKYGIVLEECLARECNGQPPPPDDPNDPEDPTDPTEPGEPDCWTLCGQMKMDLLQGCTGADGTVDQECLRQGEQAVMDCIAACDGQEPPPPTCAETCDLLREQYLQKCAGTDNTLDPECMAEAEAAVARCRESCGAPQPVTCEDRCSQLKSELLARCTADDGTVDPACQEEVERTVERCRQNCVEPPPPVQTCEERCTLMADELKAKCALEDGSLDEACLAEVQGMVDRCFASCAEPPPPQEQTCEEGCRARAEQVLGECLSQNLPDVDCKARYERVLQACLAENCTVEPPVDVPCEERCSRHSREVYDLCLKEGGSEDACREKAAEALQRCALACAGQEDDPSDPKDPPEAVPCDESCVGQAEGIFKTCVEAGGTEDECRARSDAILGLCLERCSGEAPCESHCALAAQVVIAGCSMAGVADEECRRLANRILESCVGGCRPVPTCPERCEELAASAVRECIARGGTEDECAAKGAEVAAACAERCEGVPVPPCDVQCEEKAAAMVAEWAAQGLSREEIAALRARFLEECKALLGENCVNEAKAGNTMFRTFRRGDSNRDGNVNISDAVSTLAWLFQGGRSPTCEDAADANDDGLLDISDPVTSLGCLFLGQGAMPDPFGREGQDPTSDGLVCAE